LGNWINDRKITSEDAYNKSIEFIVCIPNKADNKFKLKITTNKSKKKMFTKLIKEAYRKNSNELGLNQLRSQRYIEKE
jgi:hypothetical protein